MKRVFSDVHCKDLEEFLGVKLTKVCGCPMTQSPEVLNSNLSALRLQQFISYRSGFPALALVPMVLLLTDFFSSELWFCVFISLSPQSWVHLFALWPCFSCGYKKSCWFQLVQFFTCNGVLISELLMCQIRNQKPDPHFLLDFLLRWSLLMCCTCDDISILLVASAKTLGLSLTSLSFFFTSTYQQIP